VDKRSLKQQFLVSEIYLLYKLDLAGIVMLLARGEVFIPALNCLWGELVWLTMRERLAVPSQKAPWRESSERCERAELCDGVELDFFARDFW